MDIYNIPLQADWMSRPYFGRHLPSSQDPQFKIGKWAEDGMQCPTLRQFLESENGGLFLVAGPRGIGKTSLVRHTLNRWRDDEQIKEKSTPFYMVVDAADLGLYEPLSSEQLERILITGLLRTLQDFMIHKKKQAGLLRAALHNGRESLITNWMDSFSKRRVFEKTLVKLVWLSIGKFNSKREETYNKERKLSADGNLKSPENFPYMASLSGQAAETLVYSQSNEFNLDNNSTDALRAELRGLFKIFRDQNWPVLVLDEWDRFEKPDENEQKLEQYHIPTLEHALLALSRIKSLLADYPAPLIFIGSEELYQSTRRNRHHDLYRQDGQVNQEKSRDNGFYTIFHQQCFISPLPSWMKEDNDIFFNPLLPYLKSICIEMSTNELDELADYLLMEIGPNPHALKVFLGHYAAQGLNTHYG